MPIPPLVWNIDGALFVEEGAKLVPFIAQRREGLSEPVGLDPDPVTPESIDAAKAYNAAERRKAAEAMGVPIHDDGRLGMALSNFISASVYGPKGEHRGRR